MSGAFDIDDVAGFSGPRLARIDRFFADEVAQSRVPGAALLVERRGKTVLRRAWGGRDPTGDAPMTLGSIFRIYSMTKPIVSVAAMMLAAEGRLRLDQPVADVIPSFANLKVWTYGALVAPERPPTIHDLLRHTAGLIYPASGGPVATLYRQAGLPAADITNEEFADRIATVPLAHQPGRVWDYSLATDVLGRVVEVVEARSLGKVLADRLFRPLGMVDTGFGVLPAAASRLAQPFADDIFDDGRRMYDPTRERAFESAGMGLTSTLDDYAAFVRMLLAGGTRDGTTYLSKASLRFMTADHVGPATGVGRLPGSMLAPGFGFGLGFAVRTETGAAPYPGSVGEFNWSGVGGTYFWVDPAQALFAILLTQSPRRRIQYRAVLKTMVYDALVDGTGKTGKKKAKKGLG